MVVAPGTACCVLTLLEDMMTSSSTAAEQTARTRKFLSLLPKDQTVMLVTHQVNITELTGQFPSSGEIFIIKVSETGTVTVIGRYLVDQ